MTHTVRATPCRMATGRTVARRSRAAWSAQRGPSCNPIAGLSSLGRRSPCASGVIDADLDVTSLNCAGWVRSPGGFFPSSREDWNPSPAVITRSGAPTPLVKSTELHSILDPPDARIMET